MLFLKNSQVDFQMFLVNVNKFCLLDVTLTVLEHGFWCQYLIIIQLAFAVKHFTVPPIPLQGCFP